MLRSHVDLLFANTTHTAPNASGSLFLVVISSLQKDALVKARDEISCFRAAKRRKRGIDTPERVAEQDRVQNPRWRMIAMPSRPEDEGSVSPMVGAETSSNYDNPDHEEPTIELNGVTSSNEPRRECVASGARVLCDSSRQERQEMMDVEPKGREDENVSENHASDTAREQGYSQGADESQRGQKGHRGKEKRVQRSSRRGRPAYGVTEDSLLK